VYGRSAIDKKVENGQWPGTNYVDTFQALDGTDTWELFRERDLQKKQERIEPESEETSMDAQELAEHILESEEEELADIVSVHAQRGTPYVDKDLIELDYDVSGRKAKRVKKALERMDVDLPQVA
jgi:hypothetical protein